MERIIFKTKKDGDIFPIYPRFMDAIEANKSIKEFLMSLETELVGLLIEQAENIEDPHLIYIVALDMTYSAQQLYFMQTGEELSLSDRDKIIEYQTKLSVCGALEFGRRITLWDYELIGEYGNKGIAVSADINLEKKISMIQDEEDKKLNIFLRHANVILKYGREQMEVSA